MKPCYTTGRSGVQLLGPDSLGACSLRMRYENVFREGQIGLSQLITCSGIDDSSVGIGSQCSSSDIKVIQRNIVIREPSQ